MWQPSRILITTNTPRTIIVPPSTESPVSFSRRGGSLAFNNLSVSRRTSRGGTQNQPRTRRVQRLALFRDRATTAERRRRSSGDPWRPCSRKYVRSLDFKLARSILRPSVERARKDGGETTITTGECFHDGDRPRRAGFWADA